MTIPTFGQKVDQVDYQVRHGVYAIIFDPEIEKFILVQAPNGAWFLPGGEIEGSESKEEALKRELIEELGFELVEADYLGQADEYFYSSHRDKHFYNPAYIYQVNHYQKAGQPLEDFNHLEWFSYEEALAHLKRGSHKWGLEAWKLRKQA